VLNLLRKAKLCTIHTDCIHEFTCTILLQCIPHITVKVIISAHHESATLWERHRRDATDDVVVRVHADLLIWANVKQSAGRIVRTSRKGKSTWKELKLYNIIRQTMYRFSQKFTPPNKTDNISTVTYNDIVWWFQNWTCQTTILWPRCQHLQLNDTICNASDSPYV